ncbi:MAG: cell division protein FtsQ/DivIB [Candidatus Contendobacter sp.]|jgi:cell division protein FtsQ|nr:cell division protein FtsQ/DivIB [Candidatus Contendobacter sp.]
MMRRGRGRRHGATSLKRDPAVAPGQRWAAWKPWLRGLGVVLVLAAVGFGLEAGLRALREPGAFPLRQVRFEGELRNLTEADLQPLAQAYLGQNFFVANLDELRVALAADPWIEEVTVRRSWPDTVAIQLRERVAFGYWGERGEMVDANGYRFRPPALRQPGPWPRLAGPGGREKALIKAWRDIRVRLDPVGLTLVKLKQDERRAWWLTFDSGLQVYLGRERFEERLQRLAHVYPRVLAAQADRIAVVDLRYGNGFAVRWKSGPPAPTAG